MPAEWEQIALKRRQERDAKIPKEWRLKSLDNSRINLTSVPRECGILSAKEIDITENYHARGIVNAASKGTLKAEEIAIAFCKVCARILHALLGAFIDSLQRAAIAQQVTNCLSEVFFEEALERAKFLDIYLKENGRPLGPLHGVSGTRQLPLCVLTFAAPNFSQGSIFDPRLCVERWAGFQNPQCL